MKLKRILLVCTVIALMFTTFSGIGGADANTVDDIEQVIIDVEGDTSADTIEESKQKADEYQKPVIEHLTELDGVSVTNSLWSSNNIVATVNTDQTSLEEVGNHSKIISVNKDVRIGHPNPPEEGDEPGLGTQSVGDKTYGLEQIQVGSVWDEFDATGDGVKVAVIDTGADIGHNDISIGGSSDNEYEGYWIDYISGESEPYDDHGHGTHVAGTISGSDANDYGVNIGVAPDVTTMHAKTHNSDGSGLTSNTMAAVEWAVENDADVVSMSVGREYDEDETVPDSFVETLRMAHDEGVVVVASSGNDYDGSVSFPASSGDVIAVGATRSDETIAGFSSGKEYNHDTYFDNESIYGDWEDPIIAPYVSAPGGAVRSAQTGTTGDLDYKGGTSMAAPHVSGVVSLALSNNPELTQNDIEYVFMETAFPAKDSNGDRYTERNTRQGYGIVDAYEVVKATNPDGYLQPDAVVVNETVDAGGEIHINATISNANLIGDEGQSDVDLFVNGELAETENDVTIDSQSSDYVEFVYESDEDAMGSKELTVGTANANVTNTTEVRGTSEFEVHITDSPEQFVIGDTANVTAEVENVGEYVDDTTVEMVVDDERVEDSGTTTDELEPGDSVTVELPYTATESDGSDVVVRVETGTHSDTQTIDVVEPATFEASIDSTDQDELVVNETTAIGVDVENVGGVSGDDTVTLRVNGTERDGFSQTVENVEAGENTTVVFDYDVLPDDHPEVNVSVETSDMQTNETLPVLLPGESVVDIESVNEPVEGDDIVTTIKIENVGGGSVSQNTTVSVDGIGSETRELEVDGGETEQADFTIPTEEGDNGEYTLTATTPDNETESIVTVGTSATFEGELKSLVDEISAGQNITAEIGIENVGDEAGETVVSVVDDDGNGDVRDEKTVTLDPSETTTASFNFETTIDDADELNLIFNVGDEELDGTVTVTEPEPAKISGVKVDEEFTNDTVTVNGTVERGGVDVTNVEIGLESEFTTFEQTVDVSDDVSTGGEFEHTFSVGELVGDGDYTSVVRAEDAVEQVVEKTGGQTTVDTSPPIPELGIDGVESDTASLTVDADEPFVISDVTITGDDESDRSPSSEDIPSGLLTEAQQIDFDSSDTGGDKKAFEAVVTMEDELGNTITTSIDRSVSSYDVNSGSADISPNEFSNISVVANESNVGGDTTREAIAGSTNTAPVGTSVEKNIVSGGYLDVSDIGLTGNELEMATIEIPLDSVDSDVVNTFGVNNIAIYKSEEGEEDYTKIETEYVESEDVLVADVDGFSQFTAAGEDNTPPTIDDVTATPGTEIEPDNGPLTVTFEYSEENTPINVSATSVDADVSDERATKQVTGETAEITIKELSDGESITVDVIVTDEGGNTNTEQVVIEVEESETGDGDNGDGSNGGNGNGGGSSGSSGGSSGGGGGGGGGGSGVPSPLPTQFPDDAGVDERTQDRISSGESVSVSQPGSYLQNPVVGEIRFHEGGMEGDIETRDFDSVPAEAGDPPGEVHSITQILVPPEYKNISSTIKFDLMNADSASTSVDEMDRETLTVWHRDSETGEWEALDTTVVEDTDEALVVEAQVDNFSYFAVTDVVSADESEVTTQDEETETEGQTDDSIPGFGIVVALVALLGASLLAKRQNM